MGCAMVGMLQPAEGEDYGTMKQLPEKQSKKDSIEEEIIGKGYLLFPPASPVFRRVTAI